MASKKSETKQSSWDYLELSTSALTDASTYRKLLGDRHTTPATLLAREVIQNSEDASFMSQGEDEIPFTMDFQFIKVRGAKARAPLDAIDFEGFVSRLGAVGFKEAGFVPGLVQPVLKQNEVEPVLEVLAMSDFGARGLAGDVGLVKKSGWFNCLFSVGSSVQKSQGSGGSYGFGKSAFVNGSAFSTVVVYSKSGPNEHAESRYFGAASYWNGYLLGGTDFTGMAALGDPDRPHDWFHKPFVDEEADKLARLFGFPERGDDRSDWGTTIGILYPVVKPDDLVQAIEEFWWPALDGEKPKMSITVTSGAGRKQVVSPKSSSAHAFMPTMRSAFEIASGRRKASGTYEFSKEIRDTSGRVVGTFAAVADPQTCFDPKLPGNPKLANFSRVALTRKPRMVVRYLQFDKGVGKAPYVEGIFVGADDDNVEASLRSCEPAEHNLWWPVEYSSLRNFAKEDPSAPIALAVKDGIEAALSEFRASLRPPEVKGMTLLGDFGKVLNRLIRQPGPGGGGAKVDPITIDFIEGPEAQLAEGGIEYESVVDFGLGSKEAKEGMKLRISFSYRVVAEEDGKGEVVPCTIVVEDAPPEFDHLGLEGKLKGGEKVRIRATSFVVPYGMSLAAKPAAEIIKEARS